MSIAYDSSSGSETGSGTSLSYSHNCSGSNRFLKVDIWHSAGISSITSVTYNGTAMTQLASVTGNTYTYYLINPDSGNNTVAISANATGSILSYSASYTGVKQTSPIDSQSTTGNGSVLDTTVTGTTTVVASNCWLLGWGVIQQSSGSANISSDRTDRQAGNRGGYNTITATSDSNGTVSTGTQSMTWTITGDVGNKFQSAIVFSLLEYVPQTVTLTITQASYVLSLQNLTFILTRVLMFVIDKVDYVLTTFSAILTRTQTFRNRTKTPTSWVNRDKQ